MAGPLAQMVRAKYPGAYDDLTDEQLEQAVTAKYPGVYDDLLQQQPPAEPPATHPHARTADALLGFVKEAGSRAVDIGRTVGNLTGLSKLTGVIPGDASAALGLTPSTPAQEFGAGAERVAEFMIPAGAADRAAVTIGANLAKRAPAMFEKAARFFPRPATQAATSAGIAQGQGTDPREAAMLSAAVPAAGAVAAAGASKLARTGTSLVRAAIKPTVTTLKKMVGSNRNLDAKAEEIAQFIVDNRLASADDARKLFQSAELELQGLLKSSRRTTDAATRAERYLTALERSAAKQGLAADDVAMIRNAAADLVKGPMGEDVIEMVMKPHPKLVNASGQPIMVQVPQTTRQLRAAIPADEALESARASGRWSTRKQWGEQKGTTVEAQKAVERAQRDAVKTAVREARPLLRREGQSLTAADVLDRMAQRQGNREAISMPATIAGAIELSQGKAPVMAIAANWLRNNGLKAGIQADRLANAMLRNDTKQVSQILTRLGVALELQAQ